MKPATTAEVAKSRIQGAWSYLESWRRKNYDLRMLVAGDRSAVDDLGTPASPDTPQTIGLDELYDVIVETYDEGKSNHMLKAVKTLMMQTAFRTPEIQFPKLPPNVAATMAQWLEYRLGDAPNGCEAGLEGRKCLLDYLIAGLGFTKACVKDDQPGMMAMDSLDMAWDYAASAPHQMRWAAGRHRQPLRVWIELFGEKARGSKLGDQDPIEDEKIVQFWLYYDMDGKDQRGSYIVFNEEYEVIFESENPYRYKTPNRAFLPYTPMTFMLLPSVRNPIGAVEGMISHAMACWNFEERQRKVGTRLNGFYWLPPDAEMNDEEREKWDKGEVGAVVQSSIPPQLIPPGALPDADFNFYQSNLKELSGQGGADPYATNDAPKAQFAAEVHKMSAAGGLTQGFTSMDYAALWTLTCKKLLAVGALYEDEDMYIRHMDIPIWFDESDPIRNYLVPHTKIVINEDSMSFKARSQQIAEAMALLDAASTAPEFPNAKKKAFEKYLRAMGEQDIASWLEMPPMPVAPMPGGMPGGGPEGVGTPQGAQNPMALSQGAVPPQGDFVQQSLAETADVQ